MKDNQEYILFKSIELRHSAWISEMDNPNQLQGGNIHRSFIIEFNDNIDVLKISDYRLNDWEEFIMMTQFENYIIANSTYSYWAAILSPSSVKKVVAPLKWVNSSENHKWNQNCALSYFSII